MKTEDYGGREPIESDHWFLLYLHIPSLLPLIKPFCIITIIIMLIIIYVYMWYFMCMQKHVAASAWAWWACMHTSRGEKRRGGMMMETKDPVRADMDPHGAHLTSSTRHFCPLLSDDNDLFDCFHCKNQKMALAKISLCENFHITWSAWFFFSLLQPYCPHSC